MIGVRGPWILAGALLLAVASLAVNPGPDALTIIICFAVSVAVLNEWDYRNWRAVGLLLVFVVLMVGFGALPLPYGGVARGIVLTSTLYIAFLSAGHWLSTDPRGSAFAVAYDAQLQKQMRLTHQRTVDLPLLEHEWEAIVEAIEAIPAPSAGWQALRDATVLELRDRLAGIRAGQLPSDEMAADLKGRWSQIEAQWREQVALATRFWAGFPPTRRSSGPGTQNGAT